MRELQKVISVVVLTSLASLTFSNWTWISDDMLVVQGASQYANRLEIIRANYCDGLQLRAWAKSGDKASNTLKSGDVVEYDVRLGDLQIVGKTKVLGVACNFDEDFDIVYLDFGECHWGIANVFSNFAKHSITATFLSDKTTIGDNFWVLGGFEKAVLRLRENAGPKTLECGHDSLSTYHFNRFDMYFPDSNIINPLINFPRGDENTAQGC